jgi:lipoate-protein ligase A
VDFKRFIDPVTDFLGTLGLAAEQGPKNEILARGRKISGNAEHVYKNRVLHHGTLLFNSDLRLLRESLRITPGRYKDRAVQSNRSSVINISECLADNMELAEFEKAFFSFMLNRTKGKIMTLSAKESNKIENLATSKYRTWDWIFGWSPDYQLTNNFHYQETDCRIFVNVHRGIIKDCLLDSEKISPDDLRSLISLLENCRHDADNIRKAVKAWNHPAISEEKVVEEMVWSFF